MAQKRDNVFFLSAVAMSRVCKHKRIDIRLYTAAAVVGTGGGTNTISDTQSIYIDKISFFCTLHHNSGITQAQYFYFPSKNYYKSSSRRIGREISRKSRGFEVAYSTIINSIKKELLLFRLKQNR